MSDITLISRVPSFESVITSKVCILIRRNLSVLGNFAQAQINICYNDFYKIQLTFFNYFSINEIGLKVKPNKIQNKMKIL